MKVKFLYAGGGVDFGARGKANRIAGARQQWKTDLLN